MAMLFISCIPNSSKFIVLWKSSALIEIKSTKYFKPKLYDKNLGHMFSVRGRSLKTLTRRGRWVGRYADLPLRHLKKYPHQMSTADSR